MERAGKAAGQPAYVALALGISVGLSALSGGDALPGWMGEEPDVRRKKPPVTFLYVLFSMWGIRIFFTLLCTHFFSFGLRAIWCCMVADVIARTGMTLFCYRTGRWKQSLVFSCNHKV